MIIFMEEGGLLVFGLSYRSIQSMLQGEPVLANLTVLGDMETDIVDASDFAAAGFGELPPGYFTEQKP